MQKLQRILALVSPLLVLAYAFEPIRRYVEITLVALGSVYVLALTLSQLPGVVGRVALAVAMDVDAVVKAVPKPPGPQGGGGGAGGSGVTPPGPSAAFRVALDLETDAFARPRWRPRQLVFGTRGIVLAALAMLAFAGCPSATPGAKSPALEQATAVVVVGAHVVHEADVACAAAGKSLRESGDAARAAIVTGKCVDALRPAADALDAIATAIDAGGAVSDQQIACAVALGVDALTKVRPVLEGVGVKLGATVDAYAKLATPWMSIAEGTVCKS